MVDESKDQDHTSSDPKKSAEEKKETKPSKSNDQLFNELQEAKEDGDYYGNTCAMMYDTIDNISIQLNKMLGNIGTFKEQMKHMMNNPPSKRPKPKVEAKKESQEDDKNTRK